MFVMVLPLLTDQRALAREERDAVTLFEDVEVETVPENRKEIER
jgi:hypothetical protein